MHIYAYVLYICYYNYKILYKIIIYITCIFYIILLYNINYIVYRSFERIENLIFGIIWLWFKEGFGAWDEIEAEITGSKDF